MMKHSEPETELSVASRHPEPAKQPEVQEFDHLVAYLEQKGVELFGPHFRIFTEDYEILYKLLVYFYRDEYHAAMLNLDLRKGLLLTGPVGCGKTSLMSLIRCLKYPGFHYQVISSREIGMQFMDQGYPVVKHYSATGQRIPQVFCFDDLGSEPNMKYYGNETNVMAEILLNRYDLLIQRRIPTHITTNLSASELEQAYGNRLRSRFREMFNLIAWNANARDKRK